MVAPETGPALNDLCLDAAEVSPIRIMKMPRTFLHCVMVVACVALSALPARAITTNFFEGFEAGLTNWVAGDADPTGTNCYWGIVDSAFGAEGTHNGNFKAYSGAVGHHGTTANPVYQNYSVAYLSRTVSLAGQTNATLSFWYKTPTIEPDFDFARVLVNSDVLWSTDLNQTTWKQVTLSLEAYLGQTINLTFQFTSDVSVVAEGFYLDDITLTDAFTAPPPPTNNNFNAPIQLVGSVGSIGGTTSGATSQSNEPDPGNSIWYRWSPYTNGPVTFRTGGSAIDTLMCIYTGSTLTSLNRIGCDDNSDTNNGSLITFNAVLGTIYRISIRGASNVGGGITLSWSQPNGIGPDMLPDLSVWTSQVDDYLYGWFLDRDEVPGRTLLRASTATPNTGRGPLELRGSSTTAGVFQRIYRSDGSYRDRLAGNFTFHPGHGHLHFDNWINLHLRRVLPGNGVGEIVVSGDKTSFAIIDLTEYDGSLPGSPASGVYDGGLLQGLSVGWADVYGANLPDQWIDVTDVPSGTYWLEGIVDPANSILESNESNNVARIIITYTNPGSPPPPSLNAPNDFFTNATVLVGPIAGVTGHNTNATLEVGEPQHLPGSTGGRSVWWSWTAPADMPVTLSTEGSGIDTVLSAYTGTNVNVLTRVGSDDNSGPGDSSLLSFNAVAGTTYSFAIDGFGITQGPLQLALNPGANDHFSNCVVITTGSGSLSGSSRNTTREPGESFHASIGGSNSVWFCFTVPFSGTFQFDTIGSAYDTLLAVYTGEAVNALTVVAADNNSGSASGASKVTFEGQAGVTYRIALDGLGGANGLYRLNWTGPTAPSITGQPASTNVPAGGSATFRVTASGTPPLSYQWLFAGEPLMDGDFILGSTNATLLVAKVHPQDMGAYRVVVSSAFGSVTSAPAQLIVLDNPRVIYLRDTAGPIGGTVSVPILLQAVGDESIVRFSLTYDTNLLTNLRLSNGVHAAGATLVVTNASEGEGRIGVTLTLPSGEAVPGGEQRELLRALFDVNADAPEDGTTALGFDNFPVARFVGTTNSVALPALFAAGTVSFHGSRITEVIRLPDGRLQLTLSGVPGRAYRVLASEDLATWAPVGSVTANSNGQLHFADPDSTTLGHRFYKLELMP